LTTWWRTELYCERPFGVSALI